MDQEKFERYLKERYLGQLDWYDSKAIGNHRLGNIFQWILILSASLTPVTIAIEFGDPKLHSLKWVALLTSCIVAISASAMKAFQFHEKWMSYRAACERLRSEKFLFEAAVGDYSAAKDKEGLFIHRIERILEEENSMWFRHASSAKDAISSKH